MAMGNLGKRHRSCPVARRLDAVLLVCGELRQLRRDLRLAWRRDRLHDVDLAVDHYRSPRGRINAELEHQTARDTTEGADQPLGARGAKMADTVGARA